MRGDACADGMTDDCYARTSDHGYQTCVKHAGMVGTLAGAFAQPFGMLDSGVAAGMAHDLGKWSPAFQRRIRHPEETGKVDHSSAGALLLMRKGDACAAMAAAAHHAGLSDAGTPGDVDSGTFLARMKRSAGLLEAAGGYSSQLEFEYPREPDDDAYSFMFRTRMLLSALVDADRLDAQDFTDRIGERTETGMLGKARRQVRERIDRGMPLAGGNVADMARSLAKDIRHADEALISDALRRVDEANARWLQSDSTTPLSRRRNDFLRACVRTGDDAGLEPGAYTMTAPTGSGKTNASLTWALHHAATHGRRRIIYVIPYMSIIEQTVESFKKSLPEEYVLPHYSEAPWKHVEENDMTTLDGMRARWSENWNAPIVVTTAVQFFESLHSNKPTMLRKIHNIAGSVVIFDEAQTIPTHVLRPCVKSMAELVKNHGCSILLCSATQPALGGLFEEYGVTGMREVAPRGLCDDPAFRRARVVDDGRLSVDMVADRLSGHPQALCVVNTRKAAQELHARLEEMIGEKDGVYCLTTLLTPVDRERLLEEIRARLDGGRPCRVVSTSLIEAGVDLDFPVAFRQLAGLDSIVQTAGRCNREGRRGVGDVHVFSMDGHDNPLIAANVDAARLAMLNHGDPMSSRTIDAYFRNLLDAKRNSLDGEHVLDIVRYPDLPFQRVRDRFAMIASDTVPIRIPDDDRTAGLCDRLRCGHASRLDYRKLGRHTVQVHAWQARRLEERGLLSPLPDGSYRLEDMSVYGHGRGLDLMDACDGGQGVFV